MAVKLLDSTPTVQSVGDLVSNVLLCTFQSFPSGSVLVRVVAQADFDAGAGLTQLESLSDAVESILQEGEATDAVGTTTFDTSGLLQDNVDFTVTYVPPYPTPGQIQSTVRIPVNVVTVDTQFGSFVSGGSAADQITAEYQRLKALAGG